MRDAAGPAVAGAAAGPAAAAGDLLGGPVEVDVSTVVPSSRPVLVRGWVRAPRQLDPAARPTVLCCLPGGHCTTGYFDLQVDGHPGYSMADHLATRGFVVVALDHPGIGASSPVDDVYRVTPTVAAAAADHAHRAVLAGLADGSLVPGLPALDRLRAIGVGHSMGGMLLTVAQARHRTFDAVVGLGHGGHGLPQYLTEAELAVARALVASGDLAGAEAEVAALARARFGNGPGTGARLDGGDDPAADDGTGGGTGADGPGAGEAVPEGRKRPPPGSFLPRDLPAAVRAAFVAQQTELLFTCGLTSMLPGSTDAEKAAVTVPVFLGFGELDLIRDFTFSASRYTGTHDLTLFVLPGAAHCHNQAHDRAVLWDRMATWARGL